MNTALQHEKLIDLWNKISHYVRSNAINMFNENKSYTMVHTGAFDVIRVENDNGDINNYKVSNIWVKLVWTTQSVINNILTATHGVAILMNNFLDTETNSNSKTLEQFCGQDLTIDALSQEFKDIKGRVRCCAVNSTILGLFGESTYKLKKLHIPDITVPENQGN